MFFLAVEYGQTCEAIISSHANRNISFYYWKGPDMVVWTSYVTKKTEREKYNFEVR